MEATVSSISKTFQENALLNPTLDGNNQKSIFIKNLIRSFKSSDAPPEGQQCLPLSSFQTIYQDTSSPFTIALGQLITGALFFACRSCEYSKTNSSEKRKSKILLLENIRFFNNYKEVKTTSQFKSADLVEITFVSQKSNIKFQSVIQHKASSNICPVKSWASIKCRILSYPRTSEKSAVNTFLQNGKLVQITSEAIRIHLRRHILAIDPSETFYKSKKIGTHSIRTSFAMIAHSAGIPPYIIMMIGRWASDAWLNYIRNKIPDFSKNISDLMVKSTDPFYNINPNKLSYQNSVTQSKSHSHGLGSLSDPSIQNSEIKIFNIWN